MNKDIDTKAQNIGHRIGVTMSVLFYGFMLYSALTEKGASHDQRYANFVLFLIVGPLLSGLIYAFLMSMFYGIFYGIFSLLRKMKRDE